MKIFIDLLISSIGLGYFIYGRKSQRFVFLIPGVVMMVYSYFTDSLILSIIIGVILLVFPWIASRFFIA
ncbi:MAG: hypothetical protein WCL54_05415 [Clostridia bacterium]